MKSKRQWSLKVRLITSFVVISIFPLMITIWTGYKKNADLLRANAEASANSRMAQVKASLDIWMESYEDILFQIYTNDEIIEMVDAINRQDSSLTVTRGQLRRKLRGLFYTKDYLKSITVLTECGEIVFYDLLTGKATKTSWMENIGETPEELYERLSIDNFTHVITTKEAGMYANDMYYLFHLGHRMIDYKDLERRLGVVIVSIDERMLEEICGYDENGSECTFLVDGKGRLMSYPEKSLLGKTIMKWSEDEAKREEAYTKFVREQMLFEGNHISIHCIYDEKFDCEIVTVTNQSLLFQKLWKQQKVRIIVMLVTALMLIVAIVIQTYRLTSSLNILVGTMKKAETGKLSVRTKVSEKMLPEVQTIATQFNHMMEKVEQSVRGERSALEKQKNAEIEALEAQINPHFLYNTLDTINWMAIDEDQFEISNAIMALATILRYGIDKSNSVVAVREEGEWLRQYIFLQQTRLKEQFVCEIHIAPEVQDWKIHKLLLQPFVENAFIHGFKGKEGEHRLEILLLEEERRLRIEIKDNGVGMPPEIVRQVNCGGLLSGETEGHIGMRNALRRLKMYYGELSEIALESVIGEYTSVRIWIPKREE